MNVVDSQSLTVEKSSIIILPLIRVINKFENCWYDLKIEFEINFTNKAHIIISHVPQVIERTGRGLFNQSEEVVEAAHAKFDIFWRRYKVLDVESESHGDALLNCLNDFNTKNI